MGNLPQRLDKHAADALLAKLGEARSAVLAAQRLVRHRSVQAKAMDALLGDIDDLAGLITGDRTHFHLKPHSASAHFAGGRGLPREPG